MEGEVSNDATHIASLQNRSQTTVGGPSFAERNVNNAAKKKRGKSNKTSIVNDQENANLMTADRRNGKKRTNGKDKKSKGGCKKCCLRFTTFLFSHIGLCLLVVGYSIIGGCLFQWLESESETTVRANIKKVRDAHIEKLWLMTKSVNVLHEANWSMAADDIMGEFQNAVFVAVKEKGWDGREEHHPEVQWSFAGSLLYSVTVITTIGYGHIAPKTEMGRLATMFYALVGIPLTLLFLANIGSLFGNCFRFLYKYLCNALVWLCCPSHFRNYHASATAASALGRYPPETYKDATKSSSFDSTNRNRDPSIFKDTDTLETLRWKASTPRENRDVEQGFSSGSDFPNTSKLNSNDEVKDPEPSHQTSTPNYTNEIRVEFHDASAGNGVPGKGRVKKKKLTLKEEVRVPMFVSLLIIACYIFGGAVLFTVWEKDWDYLVGSYFCFITLSTVGFGDYVFGTGGNWDDNGKLITCALYLVFGLSIIAMAFDLMQEEVKAKCQWLGRKLGIIKIEKESN